MATNDNTLKTLGFTYQTYIALRKCLEMGEGDKVIIENKGDVTKISSKGISEQLEVKHHIDKTSISDRSSEIWNTVWNWYNNFDENKDIEKLVLFTTAKLSVDSVFKDWDTQEVEKKYEIFKNVGKDFLDNEITFRKTYNKIFGKNHDVNKLKNVLQRWEIFSEQHTIETIIDDHESTHFKFLANKDKMDAFISSLIGMLQVIPIKNTKWEISSEEFDKIFKDLSQIFAIDTKLPLPTKFEEYIISTQESEEYLTMKFVKEITKIELNEEVADAINDYCRTSKTIISYFDSNIIKSKDLKEYRKDLNENLKFKKKYHKKKCRNDDTLFIYESQDLYLESMSMEAINFNGIANNRSFFQRGVIHSIVQEGELTWHVGDKE